MQTKSKIVLILVVFAAIAIIVKVALSTPEVPDAVQIQNQINAATAAANDHNPGGVMTIISDSYTDDGGNNSERLGFLLRRGMSNASSLLVQSAPATIAVAGNTATSTSYITVTANRQMVFSQSIQINWHKETTRRYLVFPGEMWRVTGSSYSGGLDGG
jgi:hypothetical protein